MTSASVIVGWREVLAPIRLANLFHVATSEVANTAFPTSKPDRQHTVNGVGYDLATDRAISRNAESTALRLSVRHAASMRVTAFGDGIRT